jgi:ornithine cyclodeaminase/alanine dehydrogenase
MALAAVETAFAAHGRGESLMPPKVYLPLEHYGGDFRAMPAYLSGTAGIKWVNCHPENPSKHGQPSVMALFILSDPMSGAPRAVMDATLLTAHRTGAAAGLATKYLARDPATLGVIGCGAQARYVVAAHRAVHPGIELRAADLSRKSAEKLAGEFDGAAVSIEDAAGCDVVCTITPSRAPLVKRSWIRDGAHINAIGADAPGKQELDPQILRDGVVFVDEMHQATASGELNVPIRDGLYHADDVYASLGEVVAGRIPKKRDSIVTVFDSTGLAIQDLALAQAIYEAAQSAGVGTDIDLIP